MLPWLPRRRFLLLRVSGDGRTSRWQSPSSACLSTAAPGQGGSPEGQAIPVIPFPRPGWIPGVRQRVADAGPQRDFRVLSLDGGGFRGLVTARLIERIEEKVPGFLNGVDLVAGTSGGGILALLIAAGYPPSECQRLCRHAAEHVFRSSWLRSLNPFVSRYSGREKERFLRHYLGEGRRLKDMDKLVMVTAVNLLQCVKIRGVHHNRSWRPAVFSNLPSGVGTAAAEEEDGGVGDSGEELLAYQAAMRTSAAPTFFPIYQGYCDGGLISSDPALIAYTKVRAHLPHVPAERIKVLSLGAGSMESFLDRGGPEKLEWGLAQWSTRIIRLLLHSGAVTSKVLLEDLLGPRRYHRLDPVMRGDDPIPFDALHRVGELLEMAEETDLSETVDFVQREWGERLAQRPGGTERSGLLAGRTQEEEEEELQPPRAAGGVEAGERQQQQQAKGKKKRWPQSPVEMVA